MDRNRLATAVIAAGAVAIGVAWLAYIFLRFGPLELAPGLWDDYQPWALDFVSYLDAATRVAVDGSPYSADVTSGPYQSGPAGLYYYSPVLAVALLPVEGISWADSSSWWFVAHVVALGAACALMPVRVLTRALAFAIVVASPVILKDVVYGNVSTILLLPMVMTWRWLDRPLGSVALAVGVAIRPALGLLLIWQLVRRRWRAAAWTMGAGLGLILLTLPFVGVGGYLDYLEALRNLNIPTVDPAVDWESHDLGGVVRSVGAGEELTNLARLASIALGVGAMLLSLRRDREVSFMVTLMATLIVVPILWDHYLTLLVIPAALLADRWRPIALLLPLLTWVPDIEFFLVLATMALLFLVPAKPSAEPETSAAETQGLPA